MATNTTRHTPMILEVPSSSPQDKVHIVPLPPSKLPINNPFLYYEKFSPLKQTLASGANSSLLATIVSGSISYIYWTSQGFPKHIVKSLTLNHTSRYAVIGMIFGSVQRSLSIYKSKEDIVNEKLSDYAIGGAIAGIFSGIYVGRPYISVAHGFWFGAVTSAFYMLKEGYVRRDGLLSNIMSEL